MSTYAIGDVQGCHSTLERLLGRAQYRPGDDRLWMAGDLVNRGPASLAVLRWAYERRRQLTVVLGNHDLHLLALVLGAGAPKPKDTLGDVLAAPDRELLVGWLRAQPMMHREGRFAMVHAGMLPEWSLDEAETWARDVERCLRGPLAPAVLPGLYRDDLPPWSARMTVLERLQLALAAFTRLRFIAPGGRMDLRSKGPPGRTAGALVPWYDARDHGGDAIVLFGHWSALGFAYARRAVCLDTGCYRGGPLTALRLEDGAVFQEPYGD